LKPSLSVLLPVYNAQHRLEPQVAHALEVLHDLTDQFELMIVDDGSTDDTIEVARSLATCYPQVNAIRHPARLGLDEAIQTGLDHTVGEVVVVGDQERGIDPEDLRELWRLRDAAPRLVTAGGESRASDTAWVNRLFSWNPSRRPSTSGLKSGLRLMRRPAGKRQLQPLRPPGLGTARRWDLGATAPAKPLADRKPYLGPLKRFALGE
jgi:glycosyltransferase involved in cell wall biosynthesis